MANDQDQVQGITVAYLGPKGTYGHQAAAELVARLPTVYTVQGVTYLPCPTIPNIYTSRATYLVMPLQNTLHGGVTETLDSLSSPLWAGGSDNGSENGRSVSGGLTSAQQHQAIQIRRSRDEGASIPLIIDSIDLGIRHCLVAKKGTRMGDIRWVRSHEQALGQSSAFLSKHLPQAARQPWPSTAGAAASLLVSSGTGTPDVGSGETFGSGPAPGSSAMASASASASALASERAVGSDVDNNGKLGKLGAGAGPGIEAGAGSGAAICSRAALADLPGLEVLYEGTQGIDNNYTRFLLLSNSQAPISPYWHLFNSSPNPNPDLTVATSTSTSPSPSPIDPAPSQPSVPVPEKEQPPMYHHFYALRRPALIPAIAGLGEVVSVHSRPIPAPTPTPVPGGTTTAPAHSWRQVPAAWKQQGAEGRYPTAVLLEIRSASPSPYRPGLSPALDPGSVSKGSEGGAYDAVGQGEGVGEGEGVVYLGSAPSAAASA